MLHNFDNLLVKSTFVNWDVFLVVKILNFGVEIEISAACAAIGVPFLFLKNIPYAKIQLICLGQVI